MVTMVCVCVMYGFSTYLRHTSHHARRVDLLQIQARNGKGGASSSSKQHQKKKTGKGSSIALMAPDAVLAASSALSTAAALAATSTPRGSINNNTTTSNHMPSSLLQEAVNRSLHTHGESEAVMDMAPVDDENTQMHSGRRFPMQPTTSAEEGKDDGVIYDASSAEGGEENNSLMASGSRAEDLVIDDLPLRLRSGM